jgi:hypothetical protein
MKLENACDKEQTNENATIGLPDSAQTFALYPLSQRKTTTAFQVETERQSEWKHHSTQ